MRTFDPNRRVAAPSLGVHVGQVTRVDVYHFVRSERRQNQITEIHVLQVCSKLFQVIGEPQVVICNVSHEIPRGFGQGDVAMPFAVSFPFFEIEHPHSGVAPGERIGTRNGFPRCTVPDDKQLEIGVTLSQHGLHGEWQQRVLIAMDTKDHRKSRAHRDT